jgi:UDP-N-acetylmuramyl pentapeptide phosphotransferase/UDP-N-acetylglucosamine-1-phosphate transferase
MSFPDTLKALVDEGAVVWGLVSAILLVVVLTPLVARVAIRLGALDVPAEDRPRIHTEPIPRIGGVAICLGILIPALILLDIDGPLEGIIIGIPVVAAIGLYDDIKGLSPSYKLVLVLAAACIPVVAYNMWFRRSGCLLHPRNVVRPRPGGGAVGDRLRRDDRLPAPQLPPGQDLHG